MGMGFELPAVHPQPIQIWVLPLPRMLNGSVECKYTSGSSANVFSMNPALYLRTPQPTMSGGKDAFQWEKNCAPWGISG